MVGYGLAGFDHLHARNKKKNVVGIIFGSFFFTFPLAPSYGKIRGKKTLLRFHEGGEKKRQKKCLAAVNPILFHYSYKVLLLVLHPFQKIPKTREMRDFSPEYSISSWASRPGNLPIA